jgi:hypothetical protein
VEGAEAAARLNASAAAAEQAEVHDSSDPLGYGRIDIRTLTLVRGSVTRRWRSSESAGIPGLLTPACGRRMQVREGAAARQPPRYSAAAAGLLDAARRTQLAGRGRGSAVGEAVAGEAPPALRAKVLPGSEAFDPDAYLATIHAVSCVLWVEFVNSLHTCCPMRLRPSGTAAQRSCRAFVPHPALGWGTPTGAFPCSIPLAGASLAAMHTPPRTSSGSSSNPSLPLGPCGPAGLQPGGAAAGAAGAAPPAQRAHGPAEEPGEGEL